MPKYRVQVIEINTLPDTDLSSTLVGSQAAVASTIEVYSQTLDDLNLSTLIRALNPQTRKRKAKKEASQ